MRIAALLAVWVVIAAEAPAARPADDGPAVLTLWLMPSEPAASAADASMDAELAAFNARHSERGVTVLNVVDPVLVDQLRSPHPDYEMTTWDLLKGQEQTLEALGQFAGAHRVRIRVLFVTWGRAFEDLRSVDEQEQDVRYPPDVAQVGSTWAEWFAAQRVLLPPSPKQAGAWKWRYSPVLLGPASLRYTTDIRLLYYWKRAVGGAEQAEFVMDCRSWETVLESLRRRVPESRSPFSVSGLVMPIRRETNLIHRYAMLVNAGGGTFFNGDRLELSTPAALHVPLLLSRQANWHVDGQTYRLLSFPDMSHEEAALHFRNGRYLAAIEPVGFLVRWKREFDETHRDGNAEFWNHAGLAVPPAPFKGGSDLIVLRRTQQPDLSFALATYLAGASECAGLLAALGHLPGQLEDSGLAMLSDLLNVPPVHERSFRETVRQALAQGREHGAAVGFPTEIESAAALDAFQTLWHQLPEGAERPDGAQRIAAAAQATEFEVNRRLVWRDKLAHVLQVYLTPILAACIAMVIGTSMWGFQQRELRKKAAELLIRDLETLRLREEAGAARLADEQSRRLAAEEQAWREEAERSRLEAEARSYRYQCVATASCTLVDLGHSATHSANEIERKQRMKLVLARDYEFAHDARIELHTFGDVVAMALLQAADSVHTNGAYHSWRNYAFPGKSDVGRSILDSLRGTVLRCHGMQQPTRLEVLHERHKTLPSLAETGLAIAALAVPCACDAKMLVRVLSCLLENAIQAVFINGGYMPIRVGARHTAKPLRCQLSVANDVYSMESRRLLSELCGSGLVPDLFKALQAEPELAGRIGIGWQFAGMIAHQFFGGLSVEFRPYDPPVVAGAFQSQVTAYGEVRFTVAAEAAQQEMNPCIA